MWAGLGGLYVALGLLFVTGRAGSVMTSLGPSRALSAVVMVACYAVAVPLLARFGITI